MAQLAREKKRSTIPHKMRANDQASRTPTHRGTQHLPQGIPDTPDGIHNTPALSQRGCQVPTRRSAGLPTADGLTRHQECPKWRKFRYLLRTRNSQQIIFEIRRLVSRSSETHELWPPHKQNAPQTRHPRQRHRCGRLSRFYPWFAAKPVCSPPTAAVKWPSGDFEF